MVREGHAQREKPSSGARKPREESRAHRARERETGMGGGGGRETRETRAYIHLERERREGCVRGGNLACCAVHFFPAKRRQFLVPKP
jgi:hypothetical protein